MKIQALLIAAAAAACGSAGSASVTFSGSSGTLAASAVFDLSGSTLSITLTNTAVTAATVSSAALTGIFWNSIGDYAFTPLSATLASGSFIAQSGECSTLLCTSSTSNLSGEFGYYAGSLPGGADRGLASSGYAGFGNTSLIDPTKNLDEPDSPDGINFGIVTAGFVDDSGNGDLDNDPLVSNSVIFALTVQNGFTLEDISNVSFQYGTSLSEPNIPGSTGGGTTGGGTTGGGTTGGGTTGGGTTGGGSTGGGSVPEPGSAALTLLGLGLLGSGFAMRRRREAQQAALSA